MDNFLNFDMLDVPGDTRRKSSAADPDDNQTSLNVFHGEGERRSEARDDVEAVVRESSTQQTTILPSS